MKEMDNKFNPSKREEKIYENWEEKGYFKCKKDLNKKPFVVVMPPPNITGKLHIGHALVSTIQDIFIRYNRMKQIPTLWVPGTDHASIATEVKVVEKLKKEGKSKESLGREAFLKEAWEWKDEYGSHITKQIRKLGCSCDWDMERFTLDEGCSNAVLEVFIRLYNQGKIYRGTRLVNWCPSCKTTISDNEVEYAEQASHLWYIKYPIENSKEYLVVATTRPETMLGDTAVAVNPNDERYTHLKGKRVLLPLVNKYINIIQDDYVDKEFGTGVVKITPAHDPNDFEVGIRHNLEQINILNKDGTLNENAGYYKGLDRITAREKIVLDLEKQGYLDKIENYTHNVGTCYRCHNLIEPYMSLQWFVKMEELAKPAIDVVKEEKIKFLPKRFEKNYFHWMENIKDWCISRQLWWGHRIPAYYCTECGKVYVSKDEPKICDCGNDKFRQDEDTLDTWFSSALWPFSVFGWPNDTEEYKYFYPTSTLVTAYDILTFWVSKMIFSGIEYTGKIPFENVYMHGLVRDEQGRKMSKSLGNGVDPLEVIKEYGTDSLRFSLVQGISQGNDVRYIPTKTEAARNFTNKLWNAARFLKMYIDKDENIQNELISKMTKEDILKLDLKVEDKWIISKLSKLIEEVTINFDNYEIGTVISKIYDFIWSNVCDWYIEMLKPRLYNEADKKSYDLAVISLNYILLNSIKILHPFMPYITEEIYTSLDMNKIKGEKESIMISDFPSDNILFEDEENIVEQVISSITEIRNIRATSEIESSKKIKAYILLSNIDSKKEILDSIRYFEKLANLEYLKEVVTIQKDMTVITSQDFTIYLDMQGVINKEDKLLKLNKEKETAKSELKRAESMLKNEKFVSKAPAELIEKEKEKIIKYTELLEKIEENIKNIK